MVLGSESDLKMKIMGNGIDTGNYEHWATGMGTWLIPNNMNLQCFQTAKVKDFHKKLFST